MGIEGNWRLFRVRVKGEKTVVREDSVLSIETKRLKFSKSDGSLHEATSWVGPNRFSFNRDDDGYRGRGGLVQHLKIDGRRVVAGFIGFKAEPSGSDDDDDTDVFVAVETGGSMDNAS